MSVSKKFTLSALLIIMTVPASEAQEADKEILDKTNFRAPTPTAGTVGFNKHTTEGAIGTTCTCTGVTTNTPNTIVQRDNTGSFAAQTINLAEIVINDLVDAGSAGIVMNSIDGMATGMYMEIIDGDGARGIEMNGIENFSIGIEMDVIESTSTGIAMGDITTSSTGMYIAGIDSASTGIVIGLVNATSTGIDIGSVASDGVGIRVGAPGDLGLSVLANGPVQFKQALALSGVSAYTFPDRVTIDLDNQTAVLLINQTDDLSDVLTINLPTDPFDGQLLSVANCGTGSGTITIVWNAGPGETVEATVPTSLIPYNSSSVGSGEFIRCTLIFSTALNPSGSWACIAT